MGPAPACAIIEAIQQKNSQAIETLAEEIDWAATPIHPIVTDAEVFASYNIQLEKLRINAAGYCKAGPMRPPYNYMPEELKLAAEECGRRWALLCKNYQGNFRFKKEVWKVLRSSHPSH